MVSFGHFLLIACAAMIALSVLITPSKKSPDKPTQVSEKDKDNGPSNDFTALINAIHYEGTANRSEESREDFGKKVRDYITIGVLVLTLIALSKTYVAISDQVGEMRKVYSPIAEQAKLAQDNLIADHRAWIGITRGKVDLVQDKPVHATVMYNNTGRQPAPLSVNVNLIPYTYDDWAISGKATKDIIAAHDTCFGAKDKITPTLMVFPVTGPGGYQYDIIKDDIYAVKSFLSGDKVIVVFGCLLYKSYGHIRHTSYCGFDLSGTTVVQNLSFCTIGNDAD